jgi:hypothetical protein
MPGQSNTLDEDRPAYGDADGRADQGDHRQQRVAQRMLGDDPEFLDALGPRRSHIVLVQHFQHGGAHVAHDQRGIADREQHSRQDEVGKKVAPGERRAGGQACRRMAPSAVAPKRQ